MNCEKCGSDNVQRLEVVFDGGTSQINTNSRTGGVGLGRGGLSVGGANTKTTGTSQTTLGAKAAPPAKKPYKWAIISLIVGYLFCHGGVGSIVFGVLLIAAGGYFIYAAVTYNKNQWPALYKHWQECWLCHKCGSIYHAA